MNTPTTAYFRGTLVTLVDAETDSRVWIQFPGSDNRRLVSRSDLLDISVETD